jgi:hypothetical protein
MSDSIDNPYNSHLGSMSSSLSNMQSILRKSETNKPQRPVPRSMRTFRSKLNDISEIGAIGISVSSGPLENWKGQSSNVQEGKIMDKKIMEKAIDCAVKRNKSKYDDEQEGDSDYVFGLETSSFDLSQAFSDCSACSSDISGELLRLATASSSPVYNHNNSSNNNNHLLKQPVSQAQWRSKLAKSRQFGEERIQSNPHASSPTTKTTSESKNELLEPEELEVVVKALVDDLGSGNSKNLQRNAAAELRLLAKHKMENRMMIARAGAVRPLVCLLHSTDPQTQEAAVTALLNLSLCDDNKMEITRAGAIKPLIYVLKTGTSVAKQNAACALLSLSLIDDNKISIGAAGAIPPLVALLISGSSRGKKDAATTLYTLSSLHQNKDRAIRAGAIKPLVDLMADPSSGMVDKAVVVLSNLASVPDGKNAIVDEGGIPVLVEIVEIGSQKGKEFSTATLLHLCEDSYLYRTLVSREGAIPPLVALSQSGTARAKHKAATLLQYLREPRQGSLCEQPPGFSTS